MGRVRSSKRRVRDDDFMLGLSSDYPRIMLESSFYWRKHFREFPLKSWASRFRGRRSILVRLEGDFACSAHWKWRFICDAVAGAVFGEVGGWLYLLRALEMTFHMWCGSMMRFILRGRRSIWWSWRVTLLAPRIGNDVSYVMRINYDIHFSVAGAVFGEVGGWLLLLRAWEMTFHMWRGSIMTFIFPWQAPYLVKLEGDFTCSAHWKWCFICDADQRCDSFCVAGAIFGEVGGWLLLLRAL